jgi:hypothetical protein
MGQSEPGLPVGDEDLSRRSIGLRSERDSDRNMTAEYVVTEKNQ